MKQIQDTKKITPLMESILGEGNFDAEKYAVFETIAINTLPVTKRGVYDGAVMTKDLLAEMAKYVNKENFVPLHLNHMQGGELPVGRVVQAKLVDRAGKGGKTITDLHAMFYLSKGTDQGAALADGLNSAIINEVSVGVMPKSVKCSKCGFDYMGEDATIMNWIDAKCGNDHVIGEKGVHAIIDGLDSFNELSLVSLGAADHARILGPGERKMAANADDDIRSLAAGYSTKESLALLVASKGMETQDMKLQDADLELIRSDFVQRGTKLSKEDLENFLNKVDAELTAESASDLRKEFQVALDKIVPEEPKVSEQDVKLSLETLIEAKANQMLAEKQLADLIKSNEDLKVELASATQAKTELSTQLAAMTELSSELALAKDFLKLSCQNLLVASGVANGIIPETVNDLISTIKTAQGKLSKLPVGGLSASIEDFKTGEIKAVSQQAQLSKTKK